MNTLIISISLVLGVVFAFLFSDWISGDVFGFRTYCIKTKQRIIKNIKASIHRKLGRREEEKEDQFNQFN